GWSPTQRAGSQRDRSCCHSPDKPKQRFSEISSGRTTFNLLPQLLLAHPRSTCFIYSTCSKAAAPLTAHAVLTAPSSHLHNLLLTTTAASHTSTLLLFFAPLPLFSHHTTYPSY